MTLKSIHGNGRSGRCAAVLGAIAIFLAACGSSGTGSASSSTSGGGGGSSTGDCSYLTAADFTAIGQHLASTPIYNHQSSVGDQNCYYDLGSESNLAYLDFFDSPTIGQQNYTGATDPAAGNGTPAPVSGVGDSALWFATGNTMFVKKGSTVFQLKLNESGKSPSQIQADATTLATAVASRVH